MTLIDSASADACEVIVPELAIVSFPSPPKIPVELATAAVLPFNSESSVAAGWVAPPVASDALIAAAAATAGAAAVVPDPSRLFGSWTLILSDSEPAVAIALSAPLLVIASAPDPPSTPIAVAREIVLASAIGTPNHLSGSSGIPMSLTSTPTTSAEEVACALSVLRFSILSAPWPPSSPTALEAETVCASVREVPTP